MIFTPVSCHFPGFAGAVDGTAAGVVAGTAAGVAAGVAAGAVAGAAVGVFTDASDDALFCTSPSITEPEPVSVM